MNIESLFSRLSFHVGRRQRHPTFTSAPSVAAQLQAAMNDCNRELRRRRLLRNIAALGVIIAVIVVALALGTTIASVNNRWFFFFVAVVVTWGIWGGCHLNDRH